MYIVVYIIKLLRWLRKHLFCTVTIYFKYLPYVTFTNIKNKQIKNNVISEERSKLVASLLTQCSWRSSQVPKGWWPRFIILLFRVSRPPLRNQSSPLRRAICYSSHTVHVHRLLGCFCSLSSTYEDFLFCFAGVLISFYLPCNYVKHVLDGPKPRLALLLRPSSRG